MTTHAFDLADYGEMELMARAAIGIFPRMQIDPQDIIDLLTVIRRQDAALKTIREAADSCL